MRHRVSLALLVVAAASCRGRQEPVMPREPVRTPAPRGQPPAAVATTTAADAAAKVPGEVAARPAGGGDIGQDLDAEVAATLEAWRDAWQSKALDRYLSFYASDFHGDGMDLTRWAARKRDVFARAGELAVGIEGLAVRPAPEGALAEFTQSYANGPVSDRGAKTLVLRKLDGRWKILRESFRKRR